MHVRVLAVCASMVVLATAAGSLGGNPSALGATAPVPQGEFADGPGDPPKVLSTDPADGSTNVSVSAQIAFCFSATMNRPATEEGFQASDGPHVLGAANGTFVWSSQQLIDDCTAFNPDEQLRVATTYTARLDASVVRDANGSFLDGNGDGTPGDDYGWDFTVEAVDGTPPFVVSTSPPDAANDVAITVDITITFSEAMNTTSVSEALAITTGESTLTAANGTEEWSVGDEVYAFTPAESLAEGAVYHVTLNGSTARDRSGNLLDGDRNGQGGDNHTFSFVTAAQLDTTPPEIDGVDPPAGTAYVSRWPIITILFSEAMDRPSVREAIVVSGGASLARFAWPNPDVVNFTVASALDYETEYTVNVSTAAMDLAGNRLPGPYSFTFTTTPWIGTVVGSVVEGARPIPNASVLLDRRETLTSASGTFTLEGVEQGTYLLSVSKPGYAPYSEIVTIDAAHHDLGAIQVEELPFDPGPLPWALFGAVVASAVVLFVLLRRRPKFNEPSFHDWRPAEAVVVPPGDEPPKS